MICGKQNAPDFRPGRFQFLQLKLCCFFFSFVLSFFADNSTAFGVAGEEVFEFLDTLIFIDLAHCRQFTGKAAQCLFEQLPFRIGLLWLTV